jgi:hypothetical protein
MKPATATLLALLCGACATSPQPSPSRLLSHESFEDLPAPSAAAYRDEDSASFSFHNKSWRCGRFIYDNPGSATDAVRVFKETMTQPSYGWALTQEEQIGEGATRLTFVKNADRCTVEVDNVPYRHARVLTLRVNYVK